MSLRVTIAGVAMLLGLAAAQGEPTIAPSTVESAARQARNAIALFQDSLKSRLMEAIQTAGPVSAIGVCNEAAPAIAAETGAASDVVIGRTALKTRNPANAPDAWERDVLERFETVLAEGVKPASLEATRITTEGETQSSRSMSSRSMSLRYMAPIMTGGLCLTCHGEAIAPDIKAEIDRYYPDDQARGFALGDLRGAFTVTVPLTD